MATDYWRDMERRTLIGCGAVLFVGFGLSCLGLASVGGVAGWMSLRSTNEVSTATPAAAEEPRELLIVRGGPDPADPDVDTDTDTDFDTDTDTELDTDNDSGSSESSSGSVSSTGSTTRRRTSPRPAPVPSPRPFTAPGEAEPLDPEEDLGDLDLERSDIEILDEELTPRERRRLRREERRDD